MRSSSFPQSVFQTFYSPFEVALSLSSHTQTCFVSLLSEPDTQRRSSVWMCKLFYWSIVSTKWFSKSNTSPFLVLRDWVWLDILRPFGIGPASVCSSSFSSFFLLSIVLTLICWFTVLVLVSLLIFLQDAEHLLDALHQHLIVLGGKALRTGNEYPAETIRWLTRNYYFVNPPII